MKINNKNLILIKIFHFNFISINSSKILVLNYIFLCVNSIFISKAIYFQLLYMSSKKDLSYESFLIKPADYTDIKKIGSGRFGTIFLAEKDEKQYAIRQISSKEASQKSTHDFFREVELFIQIRAHPCICKFYGFSLSAPQRIVLEYLPNGSLKSIFEQLNSGKKVDYWNGTMKSKTVFGIAAALLHLQNQGAFHRFLTPSSILFDSNYEPRLVDFAFAKVDSGESVANTVISGKEVDIYQAPELDESTEYNYLCDNFSYGVILYQIVTGREAFNSKGKNFAVKRDIHAGNRPKLPTDQSPKLSPMIGDLWSNNPDERPEFIDIIKALNDYDEPLFPGTNMDQYKQYRERVIKSTFFLEDQLTYLNQPKSTEEDEERFNNYLSSAEGGNVKDMVKVARCYERGLGSDLDLEESIAWYRKAAEKNDNEALYKLANFYCIGVKDILESNENEYVKYLKKSSDKKYPPAIIDYAVLLNKGNSGVEKDNEKAEEMFKEMADPPNNYGEAQYFLAKLYEEIGDGEQAVKYFNMARENGIEGAHCDYALMLLDGKIIPANQPEGIKILKQAADRGFPMANYNLGHIYEYGIYSQAKDSKKALDYYKVAADKGMASAMVKVAKALFRGKFGTYECENDPIQAARLFEHAANLGDPEGLHSWGTFLNHYTNDPSPNMAELNIKYGGTPMNITAAIENYKKAAEAGFVPSMVRLGELYEKGVAGDRNEKLARKYLKMAVKKGSKNAQILLNDIGDGPEGDDE